MIMRKTTEKVLEMTLGLLLLQVLKVKFLFLKTILVTSGEDQKESSFDISSSILRKTVRITSAHF